MAVTLVAQLVKNLPAMWETRVLSLGWEDPLENGKATHSRIWPGEYWSQSQTRLSNFQLCSLVLTIVKDF